MGVVEHEAREPGISRSLALFQQCGAPYELALVELDAETEARLVRVGLRADVRGPRPVSLLQPQGFHRLVAAGDQPLVATGLPDRVPEPLTELRRAVELPAQLAHVRDSQGEAWHRADRELLGGHEGERLVADRRRSQRLKDVARRRSPQPNARIRRRDVFDLHRTVIGDMVPDPEEVVLA